MIRVLRETHETPAHVEDRVRRAGGTNWLSEPNFRVVWGGSRLGWVGGRWVDRDSHGNAVREVFEIRKVPKYSPENRWHIEKWMPASSYGSPELWYAQTAEMEDGANLPGLGPYPSRGEHEHCFTLAGPRGEFVPLTTAAVDWVVRAIEWAGHQPKAVRRDAIGAREAKRQRAWDQAADEILDDALSV